jgi:predicted AlkP superfamily pyrophosphatase or phosphodiesterase
MRLPILFLSLIALLTSIQAKPNIVFFLVDDLGYMDIGAYNPDTFYETPNVDQLAAGGMRFTDGYAANPVCSPTRYSIMTGKYPSRIGATNWFSGKRSGRFNPAPLHSNMPLAEVTLAEGLKAGTTAGARQADTFLPIKTPASRTKIPASILPTGLQGKPLTSCSPSMPRVTPS